MTKLKVLMLGWEFPPIINGGLGVACLGMAKALSKYADVKIILPKSDPNFRVENVELIGLNHIDIQSIKETDTTTLEYQSFNQVDFIDVNIMPYMSAVSETSHVTSKTNSNTITQKTSSKVEINLDVFKEGDIYGDDVLYKVHQYAQAVVQIAQNTDFDIIHAHDWMTFLAGIEAKRITGKPLAVHVHSLTYDRGGSEARGWVYDIEKYAMEQADIVIPVSHYTAKVIVDELKINPRKIHPVHNGAEEVEVYKSAKAFPEKMILFLGRVTLQKGPEIFLDIASKVFEHNKNVRFVMAGTGDKLKRVIETGAYKHVGDKFHFTGFLTKEKVNKLLAMTDVYCMPSVSEPFGLSALEAAQFGIPAVISKQSGVAEVLHGALKADFWDVNLMAKHILDLIEEPKLYKNVVAAGYEDLQLLSWDNAAKKIINIFSTSIVK